MKNNKALETIWYFMYGKQATHEDIVWLYYNLMMRPV
jgi:hypothetical protein